MIPVGTKVRIRLEPGCPEEGLAHGYWPYIKDAYGVVVAPPFPEHPGIHGNGEHDHWVLLEGIGHHHSWFRADELVPEGVQ